MTTKVIDLTSSDDEAGVDVKQTQSDHSSISSRLRNKLSIELDEETDLILDPLAIEPAVMSVKVKSATKRQAPRTNETHPKRVRTIGASLKAQSNETAIKMPSPAKSISPIGPIIMSACPSISPTKKRAAHCGDGDADSTTMAINPNTDYDSTFADVINRPPVVKLIKYRKLEDAAREIGLDYAATANVFKEPPSPLSPPISPIHQYSLRRRQPPPPPPPARKPDVAQKKAAKERKDTFAALEKSRNWSDCELARQYDIRNNYFPQPGTSGWSILHLQQPLLFSPPHPLLLSPPQISSSYYQPLLSEMANFGNNNDLSSPESNAAAAIPATIDMESFYGTLPFDCSHLLNSPEEPAREKDPLHFRSANGLQKLSTPLMVNMKEQFSNWHNDNDAIAAAASNDEANVQIEALLRAPLYDEVLYNMCDYGITLAIEPFYGDANDAATSRDVGNAVLKIRPATELEPFKSLFRCSRKIGGLDFIRRNIFEKTAGKSAKYKNFTIPQIRSFLSTERQMEIIPVAAAPSMLDSQLWLDNGPVPPSQTVKDIVHINADAVEIQNKCDIELGNSKVLENSTNDMIENNDNDEVIDSSQNEVSVRRIPRKKIMLKNQSIKKKGEKSGGDLSVKMTDNSPEPVTGPLTELDDEDILDVLSSVFSKDRNSGSVAVQQSTDEFVSTIWMQYLD